VPLIASLLALKEEIGEFVNDSGDTDFMQQYYNNYRFFAQPCLITLPHNLASPKILTTRASALNSIY
jgi:hypothetical protein